MMCPATGAPSASPTPIAVDSHDIPSVSSPGGTRRYSTDDIGRLHQIMALTSDGLNLAGVRRVLELQEEARRLQAEIGQLKAAARKGSSPRARPPDGQDTPS